MAALTLLRLIVAASTPLSPDEAYYWVWSRALSSGYLDHPPMVALWIRLGTLVAGDTPLGVRLLAPLAATIGTVLLADAARVLFPGPGVGWRAAALLNATLLFGVGAVTMTPDTPLLFFWTAAVWALARTVAGQGGPWWLLVGAAAGFALDSKYTAALLGLGIACWLLTPSARHWLRTPWPWAGGLLALLLFTPVLAWNARHGWASFAKQGGRTGDWAPSQAFRTLGELVAGQVGLATPLIAILYAAGVVAAVRRWRDPAHALVLALVLPGLLVFLEHAVGDRVQANWVAILYPGAALAAAASAGRWWRPAATLGALLTAGLYLQATLAPFPLARRLDPTVRLRGWTELAGATADLARQNGLAFIASEEYGPASLLAWARPGIPVLAAAERWRLFDLPQASSGETGLLLQSERRREPPDDGIWVSSELIGTVVRRAGSRDVERYRIYKVVNRPGSPAVIVPTAIIKR